MKRKNFRLFNFDTGFSFSILIREKQRISSSIRFDSIRVECRREKREEKRENIDIDRCRFFSRGQKTEEKIDQQMIFRFIFRQECPRPRPRPRPLSNPLSCVGVTFRFRSSLINDLSI